MAASTLVAGRLADLLDRRYIIWCGLGMFALASYWFASLTLDRPMSWVVWMIVARYATIGFIFTPMNAASLVLLPPERVRMGSGLLTLMQQGLGGTVGLALMTTTLQRRTLYHGMALDQQQDFTTLGWGPALESAQELMVHDGEIGSMIDVKALALLRRHLEQHATVAAYQDCFLILAGLCVAVMPLVWFLRRQRAA
jgi:DHA2 family multidrug resistance protein